MPAPQSSILDALYRRDADVATRLAAETSRLSIWEAAALGRDTELRALLHEDATLANAWAPDGHTPLGLAAFFAPASTARLLVEHGADVGAAAANSMQVQPLHAAVAAGNAETVSLLLERGADVNARQQVGYTPLMGAAAAGRSDLVDLLLARGADVSAVNDEGRTAADIARERGHGELAARLEPT